MGLFQKNRVTTQEESVKYEDSHAIDDLNDGVVLSTVPAKYRGTNTDKKDMQTLGKVQVLRVSTPDQQDERANDHLIDLSSYQRNFKFLTMLGFASTVICTWEILLSCAPPNSLP
jgi:choline transport protein